MTEFSDIKNSAKINFKALKSNMKENQFSVSRLRDMIQEKKKEWRNLKRNDK